MIEIYTRSSNPLHMEFWKWAMKKMLGRYSGPNAVLDSLKRGLEESNVSYRVNPLIHRNGSMIHVLSGLRALEWAIRKKRSGACRALVTGPNMVVIPDDYSSILSSPEIDSILVVSQWTQEFYSSILKTQQGKIYIWPAGVKVPEISTGIQSKSILIFKKSVPENIYKHVCKTLKKKGIFYRTIEYGTFAQEEYFRLLESTSYMIYLQEVESQGLALQEAWIRDVPTLVWNKGTFTYPSGHIVTGNISAPFLNNKSGMTFSGISDFEQSLELFERNITDFTPRTYCQSQLSDHATTKIYLDILKNIQ